MVKKDSLWKFLLITLTIIILHTIIIIFYKQIGNQVFIFIIVPVSLMALFFGLWAGIIMETALLVLVTTTLILITGDHIIDFIKIMLKNSIGILSHYVVVAFLGYMHKQHKTIKKLNKEIIRISKIDYLTNLYNRRALLEAADQVFHQTVRHLSDISAYIDINNQEGLPSSPESKKSNKKQSIKDYLCVFTCAIFDIDFFKKVNDNYGHLIGDKVLQQIGNILLNSGDLRKTDIYGRYGGEEFLILFPNTSVQNAIYAIQRLTERIKTTEFIDNRGLPFSITISTGISEFKKEDKDINDIIRRADRALYYAKHHGRDQTIIYEEQFTDQYPGEWK